MTTSTFQLRLRYGLRGIENFEFALLGLSIVCLAGHATCVVAYGIVLFAIVAGPADLISMDVWRILEIGFNYLTVLGTVMALLFNRPAMYFALRMLAAIEATVSGKRTRHARGWTGLFFDLFPFSILVPPGDLLAVILLMMHLRANTDHLEGRPAAVFQWSELGIAVGSLMQYVAAVGTVAAMAIIGFLPLTGALGIGIGLHAILLIGVFLVSRSLYCMRLELVEFVQPHHIDDDPVEFLVGLSAAANSEMTDQSLPTRSV